MVDLPTLQQDAKAKSNGSERDGELDSLRREQEDLLVLLADQDTKLREYRRRMRDIGAQVSDDADDSETEMPPPLTNNVSLLDVFSEFC